MASTLFANLLDLYEIQWYNEIDSRTFVFIGPEEERTTPVSTLLGKEKGREMKRLVSAILVISVIGITSASATQMAIWDFGPNAAGYTTNPTAENLVAMPTLVLSGGTLDPDGKDGVAYTDAAGVSHAAGQAGRGMK